MLKWKKAEMDALKHLSNKKNICPLLELVMPNYKGNKDDLSDRLDQIAEKLKEDFKRKRVGEIPNEIVKNWGFSSVFLDFSLLDSIELKLHSIENIMNDSFSKGIRVIPVVNLVDDEKIKRLVSKIHIDHRQGICLRISSSDLKDIVLLNEKIETFLFDFNFGKDTIDLLVDIKEIDEDLTNYKYYYEAAQKILDLNDWRSFIFASGAYPKDLTVCKVDEENLLKRFDWIYWLQLGGKKRVVRNPTFADYSIRHPIYNKSLQFYQGSASIKYTLEDSWLILRGKKGMNVHYQNQQKAFLELILFKLKILTQNC